MRTARPTPTTTDVRHLPAVERRAQPLGDPSIERLATLFRLASVLVLAATLVAIARG